MNKTVSIFLIMILACFVVAWGIFVFHLPKIAAGHPPIPF